MLSNDSNEGKYDWKKFELLFVTILIIWFASCVAFGYFISVKIATAAAPPGLMFSLVITWIIRDWKSGLGWWHVITTLVAIASTTPFVAMYFGFIG